MKEQYKVLVADDEAETCENIRQILKMKGYGAEGLKEIIKRGGRGIVESPRSAEHPGMPEAALEANPGAMEMTVPEIAAHLAALVGGHI